MGYYSRMGFDDPHYYSPRRVFGVLNRCGVDEFIVSSTCAQIDAIAFLDIIHEAREMKRLAGRRAHLFFWLSGHLYDNDPRMEWLDSRLFEGIKLHEGESHWMQERHEDLMRILSVANERRIPVMLHSGMGEGSRPFELRQLAQAFPNVRFLFAHCRPMAEMAEVVADCTNVWTDTAYMSFDEMEKLGDYEWYGRLMFGTDLPVWQAHEDVGLTAKYRKYAMTLRSEGLEEGTRRAFISFLKLN